MVRVCRSCCGPPPSCAQVCSRVQGCPAAGSGNIAVPGATVALIQGGATVATGTTVGQVTSATIVSGGSSYQAEPTVTISGNGTGATAVAIMNWAGKTVSGIFITNYGTGYSTATVAIAPPGGVGATATATAVISGQACLGYVNTGLTTIAVTAPPGMHYADNSGTSTLTCTSIVFTTTLVPVAGYTCVQGCLYPRSKTLTLATSAGSCTLTWSSGTTWTGSITLNGQSLPTYTTSGSPSGAFDCNNLTSQSVTVQFTYNAGSLIQGWNYVKCCSSGSLPPSFDANLTCPNDTHGAVLNKIGVTSTIALTLCPGPDPFLQSGTFPSSLSATPLGACPGSSVPVPIPGAFTITL